MAPASKTPTTVHAAPRPEKGPPWYARYLDGDLEGASALLRPADVDREIASATSAAELMAIADLTTRKARDPGAADHAYERVLERFRDDDLAILAAEHLPRAYPGLALELALRSGKDAWVCHVIQREPDAARAVLAARSYLERHPRSDCRKALARIAGVTAE